MCLLKIRSATASNYGIDMRNVCAEIVIPMVTMGNSRMVNT